MPDVEDDVVRDVSETTTGPNAVRQNSVERRLLDVTVSDADGSVTANGSDTNLDTAVADDDILPGQVRRLSASQDDAAPLAMHQTTISTREEIAVPTDIELSSALETDDTGKPDPTQSSAEKKRSSEQDSGNDAMHSTRQNTPSSSLHEEASTEPHALEEKQKSPVTRDEDGDSVVADVADVADADRVQPLEEEANVNGDDLAIADASSKAEQNEPLEDSTPNSGRSSPVEAEPQTNSSRPPSSSLTARNIDSNDQDVPEMPPPEKPQRSRMGGIKAKKAGKKGRGLKAKRSAKVAPVLNVDECEVDDTVISNHKEDEETEEKRGKGPSNSEEASNTRDGDATSHGDAIRRSQSDASNSPPVAWTEATIESSRSDNASPVIVSRPVSVEPVKSTPTLQAPLPSVVISSHRGSDASSSSPSSVLDPNLPSDTPSEKENVDLSTANMLSMPTDGSDAPLETPPQQAIDPLAYPKITDVSSQEGNTYLPLQRAKDYVTKVVLDMENRYGQLKPQMSRQDRVVAVKEAYEKKLQLVIAKAQLHSQSLSGKIAALVKAVKRLKEENQTLSLEVSSRKGAINSGITTVPPEASNDPVVVARGMSSTVLGSVSSEEHTQLRAMLAKHEAKATEHASEVEELRGEQKSLKEQLSRSEEERKLQLAEIEADMEAKSSQLLQSQQQIEEAREEIKRLQLAKFDGSDEDIQKEVMLMQEKLTEAQETASQAQAQLADLESKSELLRNQHSRAIQELEEELQHLREENAGLNVQLKELDARASSVAHHVGDSDGSPVKDSLALQSNVQLHTAGADSDNDDDDAAAADDDDADGEVSLLSLDDTFVDEASRQGMNASVDSNDEDGSGEKKKEKKEKKSSSVKAAAKKSPAKKTPTKKGGHRATQEPNVADTRRIKQLQKDLQDSQAKVSKLEEKLGQAKTSSLELQKQQKEIKDLTRKLELYKDHGSKSTAKIDGLEAENQELNKTNALLQDDIKRLQLEIKAATAAAAGAEELSQQNAELKQKFKSANSDAEKFKKSFEEERKRRKKYHNMLEDMKGKIRVFCRVRPMSSKELNGGESVAVNPIDDFSVSIMGKHGVETFDFDNVFQYNCTQEQVYEDTHNLIQSALDGYNVCIFAYGQTGSGKTFTMIGDENVPMQYPGLAPRAFQDIFSAIEEQSRQFEFTVSCYMVELYRDKLYDLLDTDSSKNLEVHMLPGKSVEIKGVVIESAGSADELMTIFERGSSGRRVKETKMNATSSRSHLIIAVMIESKNLATKKIFKGKLSLVDLAGSERADRTGATGEALLEGQSINKSLSALGNVITALGDANASFIPYRSNLLTRVMQDSLGGDSKTLMFVNVSPSSSNTNETLTALKYAKRVKKITNKAKRNEHSEELGTLQQRVVTLASIIRKLRRGDPVSDAELDQLNLTEVEEDGQQQQQPEAEEADV